ncbi:MAG: DUF4129 domain-containing protein [Betaproteobacteria bacterium]|nr:DUF4129 domain-containing protein [Betaproteobacteria bacterium]
MQLDKVAIALRPRSAWESVDLGVGMLREWWRPLYASFAVVYVPVAAACLWAGWSAGKAWVALLLLWWLKPLFDRVALHVASRAVFGEVLGVRRTLAQALAWLGTGLAGALTLGRIDMARSFHLPVKQLEGQRWRAARARRTLLGRRTHGYAVWLTIACLHFEAVLVWSADMFGDFLQPAKAHEGTSIWEAMFAGAEFGNIFTYTDFCAYAAAVLVIEPLYVVAGFALYLNRRTLLEGWDLEVALRRIAVQRAGAVAGAATPAVALLAAALLALMPAAPAGAQTTAKDPKREIAEVLKGPEFPHERQTMRWQRRASDDVDTRTGTGFDLGWLRAIGYAFAKVSEVALWIAAGALLALAVWWALRLMPRAPAAPRGPYRPPPSLFGMQLAPETLPADLAGAVRALLATERIREALALLYRGTLSALVHGRGIELRASDTEGEALARVRAHGEAATAQYFAELVLRWQSAAYARRLPAPAEVEQLLAAYSERLAPRSAT